MQSKPETRVRIPLPVLCGDRLVAQDAEKELFAYLVVVISGCGSTW
jgi:hypothetical protein